jgi:hypothetical protein
MPVATIAQRLLCTGQMPFQQERKWGLRSRSSYSSPVKDFLDARNTARRYSGTFQISNPEKSDEREPGRAPASWIVREFLRGG